MTDEELMPAYARGEQAAFDQLYPRHKNRVREYLLKRLDDRAGAEDVIQAVFLKLHRSRDNYRDELPVFPWLFTVVPTPLIDAARREKTRGVRIVLDDEQVAAAVADHLPDPVPLHEVRIGEVEICLPEMRKIQNRPVVGFVLPQDLAVIERVKKKSKPGWFIFLQRRPWP